MKIRSSTRAVRLVGSVGVVSLACTGLAACSSSSSSSGSSGTLSVAYQAPPKGAVDYMKNLVSLFEKQYPKIKVKLNGIPTGSYDQTLRVQLQAGTASDVVQTTPGAGSAHGAQGLAEKGMLAPLGSTAKKTLSKGGEASVTYKGAVYAQALSYTPVGLVGNRDIIGKNWPTTFSGLLSMCKSVAKTGKSFIAVPGVQSDLTGEFAQVLAASPVYGSNKDWDQQRSSGKVTFSNSAGWKTAINHFVTMKNAGCFQKGASGAGYEVIPKVASGSYYAVPNPGTGSLSGKNLSVYPMPTDSGKEMLYLYPSTDLSITKKASNNKDAKLFLSFAAKTSVAKKFAGWTGDLPLYGLGWSDLPATYSDAAKKLITSGQYTTYPYTDWPSADVANALGNGLQGLLTGQTTVAKVLQSADSAW